MNLKSEYKQINPSLVDVSLALEKLGKPQDSFEAIHVAGTNGKGSVCRFLELMYLEHRSDLKIAKYSSPHLVSPSERISVNGKDIDPQELEALSLELFGEIFYEVIASGQDVIAREGGEREETSVISKQKLEREACRRHIVQKVPPGSPRLSPGLSYFVKFTILAFEYFKRQNVDVAILEVGLGGRWDATNTISAEHCLATTITSIALDHQEYLGDTIEEIRAEKEAIKKDGVPHFDYLDLLGEHDTNPNSINGCNFKLALQIFEATNSVLLSSKEQKQIQKLACEKMTGRFSFDESKNILLDGAHNPDAALTLSKFIKEIKAERKIYILAFQDKDYKKFIVNLDIQKEDLVCFVKLDGDRSTSVEALEEYFQANFNAETKSYDDLDIALKQVLEIRKNNELVVITGSLYLVGKFLANKAKAN